MQQKTSLIILICVLGIIICCFLPWGYLASADKVLTGFDTKPTAMGSPAILTIAFAVLAFILHISIRRGWAKKITFVVGALLFAWHMRNWGIFSICEFGECIDIRLGFHLISLFSLVMLVLLFMSSLGKKEG